MLQLHGNPVPPTALPRVSTDSITLQSSAPSAPGVPGHTGSPHDKHAHRVKFMSSMGSRRIFARNGGSGTVASVHQFHLDDTATTMEADEYALQSTVQDMEAAVGVILQEIGEDVERPVSCKLAQCTPSACKHWFPMQLLMTCLLHLPSDC